MPDEEKEKEKLLDLLARISEKADEQEKIGKAIQESAHQAREIAIPLHDIILKIPATSIPPAELAHQISVASSWHETADKLKKTPVQIFMATTSAFTTSSTGFLLSSGPIGEPQTKVARARLLQVLDRSPLVKRAEEGMQRLGLDKRYGTNRTPLELLRDAQKAFGGGPGSTLIPLRESILGALAALLSRRPAQEPAGKPEEKVESIGRQCGKDGLPLAHFPDLGTSAKRILGILSDAKQANPTPEEISKSFYEGVSLLDALLESLDETKLKP